MHFLVLGVDGPAFGADLDTDLAEAHQAYMDGWADALVARGPTLSPDGERHTGSVHVVELPDLAAATRFALEEPFAGAGWYSRVTVHPLEPYVGGTMWDRPRPQAISQSSLVKATCEARPRRSSQPVPVTEPEWLYLGAVLSDDLDAATGLFGLVDLAPEEASRRLASVAAADGVSSMDISAQRWQRGGRHQT